MNNLRETPYRAFTWRGRAMFVLLTVAVGFPSAACHAAPIENVIHISVDGLPSNLLEPLLAAAPASYPNFARLLDESASTFNARTDFNNTYTTPSHTSMVTGRPVDSPTGDPLDVTHHGYTNNGEPRPDWTLHNQGNPNVAYIASVFDVAHDYGLSTALYASKTKFVIYDQSYDATTGAPDLVGTDNGRDKIDASVTDSFGLGTAEQLNANYLVDMTASQFN
ncbi:MAG: alkaline phosphatase family protein, partial [Pirellulales bacterium]